MINHVDKSSIFSSTVTSQHPKVIIFPSTDNRDCFKSAYVTTAVYIGSVKAISNPGVLVSMALQTLLTTLLILCHAIR